MRDDFVESLDHDISKFTVERFYSSDGKLTISVKAEGRDNDAAARFYAEAEYDRMLAKYGTKQAQAVREYRSEKPTNGFKNTDTKTGICEHRNAVEKTAQTPKNAGRVFKTCPDCKEFLGWVATHGYADA